MSEIKIKLDNVMGIAWELNMIRNRLNHDFNILQNTVKNSLKYYKLVFTSDYKNKNDLLKNDYDNYLMALDEYCKFLFDAIGIEKGVESRIMNSQKNFSEDEWK